MTPHSFLPVPTPGLLASVARFRMLTSSQLRRLHYRSGTSTGREIRSRRHLARLTKLGLLKRLWGIYDASPEYIYLPPDSKARTANMHTLDINELYVQLSGTLMSLTFDPEPWCHINVGHMTLKPDAYIDVGKRYFLEMDEGTQFRAVLAEKMRRYISAYERWNEPRFPKVLFVCHDPDRKRFIEGVIKSQSEPRLFEVALFDQVVSEIISSNN